MAFSIGLGPRIVCFCICALRRSLLQLGQIDLHNYNTYYGNKPNFYKEWAKAAGLTYLSKSPLSHSCIYPELLLISFVQIKGHFAGATTQRDTRTMRETTFSGWNIFQLFGLWVCFTALSSPTIDTVMPLPQVPCPTTSGSFREHSTSP